MRRNERIFKRMFKESGVAYQDSDTDSDEERARTHANNKAVNRWKKRKQLQKQEEKQKRAITPSYPTDDSRKECLGELLMIGDTSIGDAKTAQADTYLTAYKNYKQGPKATSTALSTKQEKKVTIQIDPISYDEWVSTRPTTARVQTQPKKQTQKKELTKHIDYQSWLSAANKRLSKQAKAIRKEAKQKHDFEVWIAELKEEVGTYDYWKRNKEEQLRRERAVVERRREEERRKVEEKEKKRELARDIYKHWVIEKDLAKIKQEEMKLKKERERLKELKQARNPLLT